LSVVLSCGLALGQSAELVNPHLKQLKPIVGQWKVHLELADEPALDAKVIYKWVMDGKFLEATWTDTKGKRIGTETFGWDAADKAVKMWGFDPDSIYASSPEFVGEF